MNKQSPFQHENDSACKFSIDLEELLEKGNIIRIKPQGLSMYPLFIPGRDEACIEAADPLSLKRGDVVLYRRDGGILVLHRICKIKNNEFFMVGDNQTDVEGPLRADQIRGKLISFVRKGKFIDVKNPIYRLLFGFWLMIRPLRPVVWKFTAFLRRLKSA